MGGLCLIQAVGGGVMYPDFNSWTVDCFVPDEGHRTNRPRWRYYKSYKFQYQRGEDPWDFVDAIYSPSFLSYSFGEYLHDHTGQQFKFANYRIITKEDYDSLDMETMQ